MLFFKTCDNGLKISFAAHLPFIHAKLDDVACNMAANVVFVLVFSTEELR